MVRTSAIGLLSLFQVLDDVQKIGISLAHVFGEALLLFTAEQIKAAIDAAQRRRNIVHEVHHANQFTSGSHTILSSAGSKAEERCVLARSALSRNAAGTELNSKERASSYSRRHPRLSKGGHPADPCGHSPIPAACI